VGVYHRIMDAENVASEVAQAAHHAGSGIADEFKKLGSTILSQIIGSSDNADLKHHEIKELAKDDREFSKAARAEVTARVKAYYDEYYAMNKKKQELQDEQKEKQKEEEKKLEELNEKKVSRDQLIISSEIAKTRAEIKNYGAE